MSKIKQYTLCIDGTEHLINVQKTINENGLPSIKIWFYHEDSEQSAELGYKKKKQRNKSWKKMDRKTVVFYVDMFSGGKVTIPKGEENE